MRRCTSNAQRQLRWIYLIYLRPCNIFSAQSPSGCFFLIKKATPGYRKFKIKSQVMAAHLTCTVALICILIASTLLSLSYIAIVMCVAHFVPLLSLLILSINMMIAIIIIMYCHYHATHLTCTVALLSSRPLVRINVACHCS